ncbi:MAG: antibiotic ABC transporter ATP-binding protein [Planctomycetota bacterium]|nr:MAG: antibiotic ABC transporter ATP-binding protein [Planctomycetota bacterium]
MSSLGAELEREKALETSFLARVAQIVRPELLLIGVAALLSLASAACRLASPLLVKAAIDDHLVASELGGFLWLAWGFLALSLAEALSRGLQMISIETAGQNALLRLRRRVFAHLQKLPAAFFDRTPIGRLVGRVTTDIEALQELFSSGLVTIFTDLVFLAGTVVLLLSLSAELTLGAMLIVPVLLATTLFVRSKVRRAYTHMRARISEMNGFLHEQVSGMAVVQSFAQEGRRQGEFDEIATGVRDAQLRSVTWESLLSASTEMLSSFTTALILYFGLSLTLEALGSDAALASTTGVSIGTLYAFVHLMQKFFQPLNDLSMKYTVLQNAMIASHRVFSLLEEPSETPEAERSHPPIQAADLVFDQVSFAYKPQVPVLRKLSFTLHEGEKLAIVGPTGAGKTTILNLVTRLYEFQQGRILLGGVDTHQIPRQKLRRSIGVVSQDVFVFEGTVLDNIRLAHPEISDRDAIAAADRLGLGEIVSRFERGYYERLAERGKNLSAGEKQLIAFARILVLEPKILVLDEATSNVDTHTEELLGHAVHELMQGRSSLVVAHRLSTVQDADRILVLDKGELAEIGSPEELLARRGFYWELLQRQFGERGLAGP